MYDVTMDTVIVATDMILLSSTCMLVFKTVGRMLSDIPV